MPRTDPSDYPSHVDPELNMLKLRPRNPSENGSSKPAMQFMSTRLAT